MLDDDLVSRPLHPMHFLYPSAPLYPRSGPGALEQGSGVFALPSTTEHLLRQPGVEVGQQLTQALVRVTHPRTTQRKPHWSLGPCGAPRGD